jgi:hypothetical protein
MPSRRLPTKSRRRRAPASLVNEILPEGTLKAIEIERDNLSRAESLLGCLKIALEYEDASPQSPYYPDVADIARSMLRKSIGALDPLNLPHASRNKVREDFSRQDDPHPVLPAQPPLLPAMRFKPMRGISLRIHRRDYSSNPRMAACSTDSARPNISG